MIQQESDVSPLKAPAMCPPAPTQGNCVLRCSPAGTCPLTVRSLTLPVSLTGSVKGAARPKQRCGAERALDRESRLLGSSPAPTTWLLQDFGQGFSLSPAFCLQTKDNATCLTSLAGVVGESEVHAPSVKTFCNLCSTEGKPGAVGCRVYPAYAQV